MKRVTKQNLIPGLLLAAASIGVSSAVIAKEKPIEWRYYTAHTADRDVFKLETDWANMIDEATKGRLQVKVYPGGSLGCKESDMLGALKNRSEERRVGKECV